MKLEELFESANSDKLWSALVSILKDEEQKLVSGANSDSSYGIEGNFHAVKSGSIEIRNNYAQHRSYGGITQWNHALIIGNNAKDMDALKEARRVFKRLIDESSKHQEEFNHDDHERATITIDDKTFVITCQYGRAFCWVGIRK